MIWTIIRYVRTPLIRQILLLITAVFALSWMVSVFVATWWSVPIIIGMSATVFFLLFTLEEHF